MSDKILKLSQAQTLYEDLRWRIDALPTDSDIPDVPVQDVQVNGSSILNDGNANIPVMGSNYGVAKITNGLGIRLINGSLATDNAGIAIKGGTNLYEPIVPGKQHESTFYGLAKAAGANMKDITNTTVGVYPDAQKAAIQNMLGITDLLSTEEVSTATAAHALNSTFMMNGKLHRATAAIAIGDAVEVGTNCEVVKADEVFVKNTDVATSTTFGLVKVANQGVGLNSNNILQIVPASLNTVQSGVQNYNPVVPAHQHEAVYFGLSKLAGVDLANETVTVGTYPEASKTAIRSLIGAGTPLDVQINGSSIVSSGIANIPIANSSTFGIIKIDNQSRGLYITSDDKISIAPAAETTIKAGVDYYRPIGPARQHISTFYGLAKAAGQDMSSSSNAVGTYTDAAKAAIRNMLGATSSNVIAVQDEQPTDSDTKVWLPETEPTGIEVPTYAEFQALDASTVKDVQINNTSIINNGIANIPICSSNTFGVVKIDANSFGIKINNEGKLYTDTPSLVEIKAGTQAYKPIVAATQHTSVFYGLAKAAGDTTQSQSSNAVGTYTAEASAAIRSMLGTVGDVQINGSSVVSNGVANIPLATTTSVGVVYPISNYGLNMNTIGGIYVAKATDDQVKIGTNQYKPIVPLNQHASTFYGLAKAAGDTTQSASSNAVGTYTAEAKAAIHTMLGIDPASIAAQVDIPLVETISGTTPTITGQPNVRYVCGEVSTISITPPASGSVDVIFESGSTAAVLTVPSTVKWPAWFDATALEADTTYEVLITDGVYGSVMTWAT